jgi:hypothetical protein
MGTPAQQNNFTRYFVEEWGRINSTDPSKKCVLRKQYSNSLSRPRLKPYRCKLQRAEGMRVCDSIA